MHGLNALLEVVASQSQSKEHIGRRQNLSRRVAMRIFGRRRNRNGGFATGDEVHSAAYVLSFPPPADVDDDAIGARYRKECALRATEERQRIFDLLAGSEISGGLLVHRND